MVSTQIINAVKNYTDDALRAIEKTGKAKTTQIGDVITSVVKTGKGEVAILKNSRQGAYTTSLRLNNGDFFERSLNVPQDMFSQEIKIQEYSNQIMDDMSTFQGEGLFRGLLRKILG